MSRKKTYDKVFLSSITGAIVFAVFFLVSASCVSFCFPVDKTESENFLIVENNDSFSVEEKQKTKHEVFLEEKKVEIEAGNAVAKAMQVAVIEHSQLEDEGLQFYRNPEFKKSVVWFYNQITGNEVVTEAILTYADKNDIPLSLAFALAYSESNYKVTAVNENTNHSIDRGLFQLNNNSFPELKEEDFFDPYLSAKYGLAHLRFCLDTAGNEVAALAMYNAGTRRVKSGGTPQVTLNYVSKIMNYKNGLDDLFDFQSSNWLNSQIFDAIAVLK